MKIAIVGNCGHGGLALEAAGVCPEAVFAAYCPGFPGEDLSRLEQAFSARKLSPARYNDSRRMILAEAPDVLVVDNLFCDHAAVTAYAMERNIHVFCEKPLALTLEDCEMLEKLSHRSSSVLWAMQTFRYDPWLYTAKALTEQGCVGEIRMVNCQKSYQLGKRPPFFGDRELYGGTIPWVAIHSIDAIAYLCGENFISVYAQQSSDSNMGNGSMEMNAVCLFRLGNGVLAHVNADFFRPAGAPTHGDDRVRIVGTKGILEVIRDSVYLTDDRNDGNEPVALLKPPVMFADFLRAASGRGPGQISTESSIFSTRAALLARESADRGEIVSFSDEKGHPVL